MFLGKITSSAAVGTIIDTEGKYKVKLEKNVLASPFQTAASTFADYTGFAAEPTFFDERQYREKSPMGGVDKSITV